MDDADLDRLLKGTARKAAPSLPPSFAREVLREIRLRNAEHFQDANWLQEICTLFFRPGLLAGSVTVVLVVGIAFPAAMARGPTSSQAASGLGLGVFSSSNTNMPSGLLAKTP